jgi:hypothetical protein
MNRKSFERRDSMRDHPIIQKAMNTFYKDAIPRDVPESLPLVEEFCKNRLVPGTFADIDVLFIQHFLGPFIGRIRAMMMYGLEPSRCWFVDIPYSTNRKVREELKKLGCREEQMAKPFLDPIAPYSKRQLERVEYVMRLLASQHHPSRLLVVDDGAYFVRVLYQVGLKDSAFVRSFSQRGTYVVEQTTRGHRYLECELGTAVLQSTNFPVISIARTRTKKELESPFIGAAVSRGVIRALRKCGRSTDGLGRTLVIGFGPVGQATTRELLKLKRDRPIHVYDKDWQTVKGEIDKMGGVALGAFPEEGPYDTVFGCTGYASFPIDKVSILGEDALLVSGSSAAIEFNREKLIDLAYEDDTDDFYVIEPERTRLDGIHASVTIHKDGKRFAFLNAGFPVNFDGRLECLPDLIIQITHGLLVAASREALQSQTGFRSLNNDDDTWLHEQGLAWIERYSQQSV